MLPTAPPSGNRNPLDVFAIAALGIPPPHNQRNQIRRQTGLAHVIARLLLAGCGHSNPVEIHVLPNGAWRHPRRVGQTCSGLRILIPAAGTHGVPLAHAGAQRGTAYPPDPDDRSDFRNVGIDAEGWLSLLIHEVAHIVENIRYGDWNHPGDEAYRVTYREAILAIRSALAAPDAPPPLADIAQWPLGDAAMSRAILGLVPGVSSLLAQPATWTHGTDGKMGLAMHSVEHHAAGGRTPHTVIRTQVTSKRGA